MKRQHFISLAPLLVIAAFTVMPVVAQAETQTLVSNETNSLCINPTAFKPIISGKPNYKPLYTAHKGKFPDTGKACAPETVTHAVALVPGGPGNGAGPWNGKIPGASWVSLDNTGEDSSNLAPKYYIYDATFTMPCGNQVAQSAINVNMFADNTAGAFLNGVPIGQLHYGGANIGQENFDQEGTTPHGPPGGFPFGPNVGVAGGFIPGLNTLQFVVLDESPAFTGLDFSATVTSPPCEPWWYSNKKLIKENERVPVATSGVITAHTVIFNKEKEEVVTIKCKKKDKEIVYNPEGGGAGRDEVTEFELSSCVAKPSPCPRGTKIEIIARNLNWPTHLIAGPPIRDVIEGVEFEIRCSGSPLDTFKGTLMPTIGNSVDVFGAGSGELEDPLKNKATFTGTEKLTGPKGDEKITAG